METVIERDMYETGVLHSKILVAGMSERWMTVTVMSVMNVNQRAFEAFHLLCQAYCAKTRMRPGNLGIQVTQDLDRPCRFVVIEDWRSRADYEGYNAWIVERGDFAALFRLIDGDIKRSFLEHVPV